MQGITDVVTLNVSGKRFQSTRSTLSKSPFLEALIKTLPDGNGADPKTIPFIDRDAKGFRHVLSLLRDPTYPFPRRLNHELAFYGLAPRPPEKLRNKPCWPLASNFNPDVASLTDTEIQLVPMSDALEIVSHTDLHDARF